MESGNINPESIPPEIRTAAAMVENYAKTQGWKDWMLMGLASRELTEALLRDAVSMDYHFIRAAITAGGVLTMSSPMTGQTYFRATMNWKGQEPISGLMTMAIDTALSNLNKELEADAADEMIKNGGV